MKNKLNLILIILIILLAAFLRLYRISDYMTFLGDEGRDVLVAKGILEGHFTLLGPRSSAGDFFMGPVYYYMIAPFLWLFRLDPVGPAVMAGLFGVATVFLIYFIGKRCFGQKAGLFSAALYAVSPLVIAYSRSSWNPNVLPFFSLLLIYMVFKAVTEKQAGRYLIFGGFLLGIAMQLHYLSLFLAVIIAFYIFASGWYRNKKIILFPIIKQYLLLGVGFLVGLSPFLAFEARHGFPNTKTIFHFIFGDTLTKGYETHTTFISTVTEVFFRIFARLVFSFPSTGNILHFNTPALQVWAFLAVVLAVCAIAGIYFIKNKLIVTLFYMWLFISILLFGFYKKSIYDYHFTFLFPLPFLIVGNLLSWLYGLKIWKKQYHLGAIVSLILFSGIFLLNLSGMPFRYEPNRQKDQARQIAQFVISKTGGKPYNFALISGGNSDYAYRYYFEMTGHKPVTIENTVNDPQRKSVTNQLLVVCEDTSCKPLGHPLFDVAGFGRASIAGEWNVIVVKVYKLVHYKEATQK